MRLYFNVVVTFVVLLVAATCASAADYDIDFRLTNSLSYGSVQFDVAFGSAPGSFAGTGATVSCTANAALNSIGAFNETGTNLSEGFIATTAFTGPVVMATCVFSSTGGAPTSGQFSISIVDWDATHGTAPAVSISRIALH